MPDSNTAYAPAAGGAPDIRIVRLNDRPGLSTPSPTLPFGPDEDEEDESDEYESGEYESGEYEDGEEEESGEYEYEDGEEEEGEEESGEYEEGDEEEEPGPYRTWDLEEDEGPEARASDFRDFSAHGQAAAQEPFLVEAGPRRLELPGRRTPVLPTPDRLEGMATRNPGGHPAPADDFASELTVVALTSGDEPRGRAPGEGLWDKSSLLADGLSRLPLTREEIRSLYDAVQRDPRAYMAIARLCGITRTYMETAERMEGASGTLAQEIGGLRQTLQEKVGDAYTNVSSHADPRMLADLLQAVTELRVLREGFDLVAASAETPVGNPRLLGLVTSVSLLAWQQFPGQSNGGTGTDPYAPPGSAQDFLGRVLGRYNKVRSRKPQPMPGEYLLGSVDIQVGGRVEPIWFLTQVTGSMNFKVPARREDGEYRMVQGLVDGLLVVDPDNGRVTTITDESGYGPLVLSRRMQPIRNAKQEPIVARDNELMLDKEGTFFLEPAYLASRCGLLDADSATRSADPLLPATILRGQPSPHVPELVADSLMPAVPRGPLGTTGRPNPLRTSGPVTNRDGGSQSVH